MVLPAPERPTSATRSPGRTCRVKPSSAAARAAVAEADVLEVDRAAGPRRRRRRRRRRRWCAAATACACRPRSRRRWRRSPIAVIDTQPDICARRVASSPAVAMSPAVAAPRVQSQSAPPISTTGSAPASVISQKRKAARGRAEVDRRAAVAGERVERGLVLVHAVAEELDGGDVGDGVDHLAGHHRPRGGARLRAGADARHVVADQHGVAAEPDRHRRAPARG